MIFRHTADLPQAPLPNAALLGWKLVSESDAMNFTSYEAKVPCNSTLCLQTPSDGMSHIYYCISGEGTCTFTSDGTKYSLQPKHLVAMSSHQSCDLTVSSPDGMRLFVAYFKDKTDSSIRVARSVQEISGTERDNDFKRGHSRRLLLRSDGFLVGFNITTINPGAQFKMQYQHHLEMVYFYAGGKVTYTSHDENVEVQSKADKDNGTLICMDKHDKHTVDTTKSGDTEDAECVCIFYPALVGQEAHSFSADGFSGYELIKE